MLKTKGSLFSYPNARSFVKGQEKQSLGDYRKIKSYFRSGFPELASLERRLAELVNIEEKEEERVLLTNSGMSAVATALDMANLGKGDIIVHGQIEYSKIYDYINEDLRRKGVSPLEIDASDISAIDKTLKQQGRVRAVLFETVANGPSMPVLDIKRFLELKSLREINPLVIIDNTLPTDSTIPLTKLMRENRELSIIALQSATKFYLRNEDTGGILYVVSNELRDALIKKRTKVGSTPGPALVKLWEQTMAGKKQFDKEMQTFMRNTSLLAKYCTKVAGSGRKFKASYPTLPIAPVLFLTPVPNANITSEEMFYELAEKGAFKDMIITESFGFGKTGVSHSKRLGGYIRIAGGLETENETTKLARRLSQALSKL